MIKITKLNKYFYHHKSNEIHVINDVSLQFPQTGLVTIFGESGSGKTTLMNVMGGLDDFYNGTIEIDNFSITKYSSKVMDRIRNEKIGYIFQNYLLLQQRTVSDNLKIVLNMYNLTETEKSERIDYVLKAVGMLKYKKKSVSELSGGQQQRVAIARALIKSPSLILADEPTGNLDEKNTIQIMNIIKKISKNTLVILVSHERNIATSYSDYIIEVKDGKIVNHNSISEEITYKYEDDQNIYLKEFEYKKVESDGINIDFYSNEKKQINLQIVYQKGKFFIKSSNDVIFLDNESEINLINDYKKELKAEDEIQENDYDLKPLKFSRTPSLSFKEKYNLAVSNLKKMKKRTRFLSFPLIIIVILILLSVQNIITSSYIDRQNITTLDSRIYNISIEKGDSKLSKAVHQFGFKKFCEDFQNKNENIELVMNFNPSFVFTLPSYTQISNKKYYLSGCSMMPIEQLKENSIIYGKMPENLQEVVVDKWVLENTLNVSALNNFMSITSFLNKEITLQDNTFSFKIVGICEGEENTMYMNKWSLLDIFPSELKKSTISVCSIEEYEKYTKTKLSEKLDKYSVIKSNNSTINNTQVKLNDEINVEIIKTLDNDFLYDLIVSDELFNELFISVLATNYNKLDVLCENELEKRQVDNYVASVYDYYANGELKADEESGFDPSIVAFVKDVKLLIKTHSDYDDILNPYIIDANKTVTSRILITFTILILSMIIIFFSMKSYSLKNMYDISVYRAIGIKKSSIVFVYALEILFISLKTTFLGGIICYLLTYLISTFPLITIPIGITFSLFLICTFGLILLNVLVGIIPIIMYLRLTPSQLLTKYDI